jgi:hypothetical protein
MEETGEMEELHGSDVTAATPEAAPSGRPSRSKYGRPAVFVSAGVALSLGLAAGGYGIASATTKSSPSQSALAASASAKTPSTANPATRGHRWGGAFGRGGFGGRAGFGFGGGAAGFGLGFGAVVKSISPTSVTISRPGGTTMTVTTNGSTQYREGLVKVSRSALAVGEHVAVLSPMALPVPPSGGKPATAASSTTKAATLIEIILPGVSGKVVSVSGSTIVVQDSEGFWRTVDVTSGTAYESAGKTATESAVKKGELISASGAIASNHTTLDASAVAVLGTGATPASFQPGAAWSAAPSQSFTTRPGPGGAAGFAPGALPGPSSVQ